MKVTATFVLLLLACAAHAGEKCNAPPFGDTKANYATFAKRFDNTPMGTPKGLLSDICSMKFGDYDRTSLYEIGLGDGDIEANSTTTLANMKIAVVVAQGRQPATPTMNVYALFLCAQESCYLQSVPRNTPAGIVNTFGSLSECRDSAYQFSHHPSMRDGRFPLANNTSMWYECRGKHVETWERP